MKKMNESGTTGKPSHQSFMRATYHTFFNMACMGTCKCNRTPFPSRTDKNCTIVTLTALPN